MNQKDRKVKVVLCTVTAVLAFSNFNIAAHAAADVTSVLPSAGVDYTLAPDGTSLKNIQEGVDAGQQVAAMNGEVDSSTAAGVLNHVVNAGGLGGTENGAEGETQAELQARIEPAEDLVIAETKTVDVSLLDEKILKDVQKKLDRKDEEEGFKSLVINLHRRVRTPCTLTHGIIGSRFSICTVFSGGFLNQPMFLLRHGIL